MKQERETNSRYARHALLFLLAVSILAALAVCGAAQTKQPQPTQSAVVEALNGSFGAAVEAVSAFKPFYLTGDFNGDGVEDILIVVRIKQERTQLPKDIRLLSPFGYGAKATFPSDPANKPTLALVIIHGAKTGWQSGTTAGKFILFGDSPILILNNERAISSQGHDRDNLMELIRKRARRTRGATRPPAAAQGDAILLGTEAADSILYWNGKTYRWQESEGGE